MKIMSIHNYHRKGSASGDDQVFQSETAQLEQHGVDVVRYTVQNDSFDKAGNLGKIMAAFGMLWSFKNYKAVKCLIEHEKPDIVHIHTFFPLLSPSILYAAHCSGCKVVATLHDTRFICPCATSLRGIELCNQCGDGHYFRMCRYKCFKNSGLQSFIVACIFTYHRWRRSFYKQIDRYICLNDNQITLLKQIGFDKKKIVKKYNFVPDSVKTACSALPEGLPSRYVVFYGRIGEEKGIHVLERIWDLIPDIPLVVIGSGPLENEFRTWANNKRNIFFLGYIQHDQCLAIVQKSEFVIFPSIWYEGCSMVEIEAESLGKPLIATDLGFSREAIQNGYNGLKVTLNDVNGFVDAVRILWENPCECARLGKNARLDYESKYRPEDNFQQLMNIYGDVLNN